MKEQIRAQLILSRRQYQKLMQWKRQFQTTKTECKVEVEPSVEREGPFYFLFTDKDGEKYGRANKLSGLDKALSAGATEITKEEYFARKTVHTQVHNKILVHLTRPHNQGQ